MRHATAGVLANPYQRRGTGYTMLGRSIERLKNWSRDETGLETLEWILLLGAFVIPVAAGVLKVAELTGHFYAENSWVISLPFP